MVFVMKRKTEIKIDVSGLVQEARPVALQAAEIFIRHTRPWFIGLTCFGSATKGWVVPAFSDIDFHLYLKIRFSQTWMSLACR
jgi:hypothetical protein